MINEMTPILCKSLKTDKLTEKENKKLNQWLNKSAHNQKVFEEITDKERVNKEFKSLLSWDSQPTWQRIQNAIQNKKLPK